MIDMLQVLLVPVWKMDPTTAIIPDRKEWGLDPTGWALLIKFCSLLRACEYLVMNYIPKLMDQPQSVRENRK